MKRVLISLPKLSLLIRFFFLSFLQKKEISQNTTPKFLRINYIKNSSSRALLKNKVLKKDQKPLTITRYKFYVSIWLTLFSLLDPLVWNIILGDFLNKSY